MAGKRSPRLARFLSDFTLGFSDGLTVPFALSAGLSSLGRTDTVIEAGVAELCAGSISMGIGGYLAARDELAAQQDHQHQEHQGQPLASSDDDLNEKGDERKGMLTSLSRSSSASGSLDEKHHHQPHRHHDGGDDDDDRDTHEEVLRQYLVPLALPRDLSEDILAHLRSSSGLDRAARSIIAVKRDEQADSGNEGHLPVEPIASGLFISLGYVVGGLIPLLPYIFTSDVALGLIWSIVVCLVSLFLFGAGKTWLLRGGGILAQWKQCMWEGTQMLVLGSLAAGASALCVMLVGDHSPAPKR